MRLRAFLLVASFFVLALPMKADTTYTYTGNSFTSLNPPTSPPNAFTMSDSISGYVVLTGPIAANTGTTGSLVPVDPDIVSYSFTDGVDTISNTSPSPGAPIFTAATDGSGNIIAWTFDFSLFSGADVNSSYTDHGLGLQGNDGALDSSFDSASNSDPGSWALTSGTSPSGPASTPEPASIALLGTGLAGAAGALRRRFRRA